MMATNDHIKVLQPHLLSVTYYKQKKYVTESAKRGLIAFLNFQLQSVVTHNVLSLLT